MKMPFSDCQGCKRRRERLLRWLGVQPTQKPQDEAQKPAQAPQAPQEGPSRG